MSQTCAHTFCRKIWSENPKIDGVALALVAPIMGTNTDTNTPHYLMCCPVERYGPFAGQVNVFGGARDELCLIDAANREFHEEVGETRYTPHTKSYRVFDETFRVGGGPIDYMIMTTHVATTLVIIGKFDVQTYPETLHARRFEFEQMVARKDRTFAGSPAYTEIHSIEFMMVWDNPIPVTAETFWWDYADIGSTRNVRSSPYLAGLLRRLHAHLTK